MLGPAWFNLGDKVVQPFAVAPWADDSGSEHQRLPGILRRLRGEWVCVPFGIERSISDLPEDWRPRSNDTVCADSEPHGRSSNAEWQLRDLADNRIELILEYPSPHPVKMLRRSIRASMLRPLLELSLHIEARMECELPIGLHPTFRLPTTPRRATLDLGPGAQGWTPPVPLEPHIARFRSDTRQIPLDRIPLLAEGVEDITRLPLPYAAEEAVLVTGHSGRAILTNVDEGYTVTLSWDPATFPACQLWLSNQGRENYPWNGRFLAVGIEPICAAFDLGSTVSRNRYHPLWRAGISTAATVTPSTVFNTSYRISLSESACKVFRP